MPKIYWQPKSEFLLFYIEKQTETEIFLHLLIKFVNSTKKVDKVLPKILTV
jgi:hypothetical protein